MDASKPVEIVRINLTPAQAQEVQALTGREAAAIELTLEELEQRIAPRLSANSNETLLSD
ncbi:MAG TPA: hypothetical protein VLN49_13255 [Gemmatimonadaceae bacterium]|nr:hypothetical protein [Gemmatimonadaceae bacterium]